MTQGNPRTPCQHCSARAGSSFDQAITMAFQPIFDLSTGAVFAQEALVRGKDGSGAAAVFAQVTEKNRYQFDQLCRTRAIEVATGAGITSALSINFMPNAVYEPRACIARTLWAADRFDFDVTQIIFELTEDEQIRSVDHLRNIVDTYKTVGFRTAIDDFGAGYAGLGLLVDVKPDLIKLDRHLIVGIDGDARRQAIVGNTVALCADLGIAVIAEGIETAEELATVHDLGIPLVQGYYLARPQLARIQTRPDDGTALDRYRSEAARRAG